MADIRPVFRTLAFALALGVTTSSCSTQRLWQEADSPDYVEQILAIYLSSDAKKLAAIGRQHHYVFNLSQDMLNALRPPERSGQSLTIKLAAFSLTSCNDVTGHIIVTDPANAGSELRSNRTSFHEQIKGTRYRSGHHGRGMSIGQRQPYEIRVRGSASCQKTATKILLTPIALVFDGVAALEAVEFFQVLVDFARNP